MLHFPAHAHCFLSLVQFFPFHAGHQICSFCITTFPTLKKVCHASQSLQITRQICFLCQHGFISACSTVADKPPTHWSFSRDCAVSSFLKPPKVPQSRELKSRSGSCTYNLHHAVCFLRTSYQLMLKMAYCQPKWTHGVLSALVKCGHEPNKSFVPIQESNISTQNFVLLWLEFAFWFYLLLIYSLLDDL